MAQSDFERMQELIEFLNHCRYEYFDLCKLPPTVPNEEYDKLMQELAALGRGDCDSFDASVMYSRFWIGKR